MTNNSNQPKHTQGEWSYAPTGKTMDGYSQSFGIMSLDERTLIAGIFKDVKGGEETAEANAQRIVKAVNMHDELLKRLSHAKTSLSVIAGLILKGAKFSADKTGASLISEIKEIEQFLKQAEGK